jgi:hypothetical protein
VHGNGYRRDAARGIESIEVSFPLASRATDKRVFFCFGIAARMTSVYDTGTGENITAFPALALQIVNADD